MSPEAKGSATLLETLAWLEANRAKVLALVGILAALIAAVLIWRELRQRSEERASAAVLLLEKPGFRSSATNRTPAQAFLDLAKANPGTEGGGQAMLLAAEALFTEGKFTEATSQFERFTKEYPSSPLCAGAALGIAACLEAQNKPAEALTAYQAVTTRYAESPVTAQARLAVGRLHELAKHPDQALRIYDELSKPTSTSAWAGEARQRREALLKAHPELVPTNAVPALPTPTLSAGGSNPAPLVTSNAPAPQLRP